MKKSSHLIAIYLFSAIAVFAQSKIDGRVVNNQGGGIAGVLVSCGGGARTADSKGNFTVQFEIGPGRPIQCEVKRSGWGVPKNLSI
jgi:hypothetical protein